MNEEKIKVLEIVLADLKTEQAMYGAPGKRYWLDTAIDNLSKLIEAENSVHQAIYNILSTRPNDESGK